MKTCRKRLAALLTALLWACSLGGARAAEEAAVTEIHTYEDLLLLAEAPSGSYRLMANIDMAGQSWTPVDFSGELDGNGYALLNLRVETVGAGTATTYDGNYKTYDTCFAGLFGTLTNARVFNLELCNVRLAVTTDSPCFIGSIAGYSDHSLIQGCRVTGTLELTAHDRMFGVGGIVGYGSGSIEGTEARVTLICTDTDAETRDEQFMGGAYAAGHMDLKGCTVDIDGYDSDHGYVHNGGLVGMYIFYPRGLDYQGTVTDNSVTGQITFFEDNTNRRAYCNGFIGEIMNWNFINGGNRDRFTRNEVFDYTVDLKPHMCDGEDFTETVTAPGCDTFGYTTFQCRTCGYTDTDRYTLFRHTVTAWKTVKAPTVDAPGTEEGACDLCGTVLTRETEKLPPEPQAPETPEPTPAADPRPASEPGWTENLPLLVVAAAVAALAAALVTSGWLALCRKSRKKRR